MIAQHHRHARAEALSIWQQPSHVLSQAMASDVYRDVSFACAHFVFGAAWSEADERQGFNGEQHSAHDEHVHTHKSRHL